MTNDLPNIETEHLRPVEQDLLTLAGGLSHPPRVLMLHGLLRARSYSRLLTEEVARVLRRFGVEVRMITIPNQSSVPKAFGEFHDDGRMKPSPLYNRMVDVMEGLMKFTLLTRGRAAYLVDRYSERVESAGELSRRVNQVQD
ncbi:MAG: hypothetical protein P1U65_03090 [Minwuia sp.]|nr:hypothetical protein [Minwuia sp.]